MLAASFSRSGDVEEPESLREASGLFPKGKFAGSVFAVCSGGPRLALLTGGLLRSCFESDFFVGVNKLSFGERSFTYDCMLF